MQKTFLLFFSWLFWINCFFVSPTYANHPVLFVLNTDSFSNQEMLPIPYTCDGKNISPQLNWSGAPDKTVTFVVLVSDPDAPHGVFYHWILYNLPQKTALLPEGVSSLPAGTMIGENSFGNKQYNGPCPPKGASHHYIFSVYALDTTLKIPDGAKAQVIISAMRSHVIGEVDLSATYTH